MYAALAQGQLILAKDVQSTNQYICPQCLQPVQWIKSPRPYFRHYSQSIQATSHTQHDKGKRQLAKWLQQTESQVALEVSCLQEKRRCDVQFYDRHQQVWAVEYQCAPLSASNLAQRHKDYRIGQFLDWWCLGPRYFQQWSRAQKFIQYQSQWGYFIPFLVDAGSKPIIWSHLQWQGPRLYYRQLVLPTWHFEQPSTQPVVTQQRTYHYSTSQLLRLGQSSSGRSIQLLYYEHGLSFLKLSQLSFPWVVAPYWPSQRACHRFLMTALIWYRYKSTSFEQLLVQQQHRLQQHSPLISHEIALSINRWRIWVQLSAQII